MSAWFGDVLVLDPDAWWVCPARWNHPDGQQRLIPHGANAECPVCASRRDASDSSVGEGERTE